MSALAEEEEDADTPARDHWSLLSQGAEARVYGLDLCGLPAVAKHRHRKAYRIAALDGRLRRDRTLAEARAPLALAARGVPAPAVLGVDAARCVLYLERVPGPTARAFVDANRADPARVGAVLAALGGAVARLHAAGLVHGDLTTSNAVCRAADDPVLIDFGLAGAAAQVEDRAVDLYACWRGPSRRRTGTRTASWRRCSRPTPPRRPTRSRSPATRRPSRARGRKLGWRG